MRGRVVAGVRTLGRSGIEVFPIGLGCWAIGGPFARSSDGEHSPMGWGEVDDDESIRAIHHALDRGVNFFDTANNYGAGHSERILGRALAGRRDGVVIATKFASVFDEDEGVHYDDRDLPMTYDAIREACEGSLRRLQTDYVDVYLLHHGEYDLDGAAGRARHPRTPRRRRADPLVRLEHRRSRTSPRLRRRRALHGCRAPAQPHLRRAGDARRLR